MSFACILVDTRHCHECGRSLGRKRVGQFCSPECADSFAEAVTAIEQREAARRANEDRYAAAVTQLRALGWSYSEIDVHLEWWKT